MSTFGYPVLVHIGSSVTASSLPVAYQTSSLDVTVLSYEKMTVAEARAFVTLARERPLEGEARVVVLQALQLSDTVQNTLLKILEEPPTTTRLHLIVPTVGMLLPTVRSRVQIVSGSVATEPVSAEVANWLAASVAERLASIMLWQKSDATDHGAALLRAVGVWLSTHTEEATPDLRRIYQAVDGWYRLNGASRKMLLEELALRLPVIEV